MADQTDGAATANGDSQGSADILKELVSHLSANRTNLRQEWARRIGEAQLLTALTSEEIFEEAMAQRIWPGTRALAQLHLDQGQRVWLVTAAPVEIARIIAHRLGLTGALGTVAETEDGVYTGRLFGELLHGQAKAAAIRSLAAREGLDLRRCTAYSDSVNDVPMLSVVGTAVAINPDGALRDIARKRDWQIRDFRTGRKAAKLWVPPALGVVLAGIAAILWRALWRRSRTA